MNRIPAPTLLDDLEREADLEALRRRLEDSGFDPRRQLRDVVEFNVRLFAGAGDVLEVIRAAGSADSDLVSLWRDGEEGRRVGQAPLIRAWAEAGALRPGLTEDGAADISDYRAWLGSALEELLFP